MTKFHRAMSAIAFAAAMSAAPAFAQDVTTPGRDSHFDGFYIQGFGGYSAQNKDSAERLKFDTDGDGSYDDTVRTTTKLPIRRS
jgi:outer membrane immunogenic protein